MRGEQQVTPDEPDFDPEHCQHCGASLSEESESLFCSAECEREQQAEQDAQDEGQYQDYVSCQVAAQGAFAVSDDPFAEGA